MSTETPSLDTLKTELTTLKGRADAVIKQKEGLNRDAGTAEQRRTTALAELAELGYPNAKDMSPEELTALRAQITTDLQASNAKLSTDVATAEGLLGISSGLDL